MIIIGIEFNVVLVIFVVVFVKLGFKWFNIIVVFFVICV